VKSSVDAASVSPHRLVGVVASNFVQLTSPRVKLLVLATTFAGFYSAADGTVPLLLLINTLFGTALAAGGASALNMYAERELDAMMRRTALRPLPSHRLQPTKALVFALSLSTVGIIWLLLFVNHITGLLSAVSLVSYLFFYTPLKTRTWVCTLVGAVPGALPAMMGWTAVDARLSSGAWVFFAIVFLWQLPHFYSIGWMYREDYAKAGFPFLSSIDTTGNRTGRQTVFFLAALIVVSLIPPAIGLTGTVYLAGAVALGLGFMAYGVSFAHTRDLPSARRLFLASICYLPALLTLLMSDKVVR